MIITRTAFINTKANKARCIKLFIPFLTAVFRVGLLKMSALLGSDLNHRLQTKTLIDEANNIFNLFVYRSRSIDIDMR